MGGLQPVAMERTLEIMDEVLPVIGGVEIPCDELGVDRPPDASAPPAGLEPATVGIEVRCSDPLSYGGPGRSYVPALSARITVEAGLRR